MPDLRRWCLRHGDDKLSHACAIKETPTFQVSAIKLTQPPNQYIDVIKEFLGLLHPHPFLEKLKHNVQHHIVTEGPPSPRKTKKG